MITRTQIDALVKDLYHRTGAERFFAEPLIRVAAANDPFFLKFKEIIGEFHWTPDEALKRKFPEAEAKSVISWVLPGSEESRRTNRSEKQHPSPEWAAVRSFGEMLNEEMRFQMAAILTRKGYPACAPHLDQKEVYPPPGWDLKNFTSSWSERHVAFVAGAGTFGLHASLITERGSAMRLGSVVTTLELEPDSRPYGDDHLGWCTRCGACIRRCPAQAIGRELADRDKPACANYCGKVIEEQRWTRYGWAARSLGCALCQTAVPCEFQRPEKKNAL